MFGNRFLALASFSFASNAGTDMLYVCGSISTKSTSAPQYKAQLAEATKEIGLVQYKSPGPSPNAKQAICNHDVAELQATA